MKTIRNIPHLNKRVISFLLAVVMLLGVSAITAPKASAISTIMYRSHIQNRGWESSFHAPGEVSGTVGQSLRDECIDLRLMLGSGTVTGQAHVENIGWMSPVTGFSVSVGTVGRGLKLECVRFRLNGDIGKQFILAYRCHVQSIGWTSWASDFESCGTVGRNLRIEAIQFQLLPRPKTTCYVHTNGANLNVRSAASANSAVIGKLPNNAAVGVVEWLGGGWAKIIYQNQIGYVSSYYLYSSRR